MNLLELLSKTVRTALRLVLWGLAALLSLALITVALVALLSWALVSLLLGRKPQVSLRGRFQSVRQFGGGLGPKVFRGGVIWPRPDSPPPSPGQTTDAPLARRITQPDAVVDVEARDLPPQRGGH